MHIGPSKPYQNEAGSSNRDRTNSFRSMYSKELTLFQVFLAC